MNRVTEILNKLKSMRPEQGQTDETWFEAKAAHVTLWLYMIAGGVISALGYFALAILIFDVPKPSPSLVLVIALIPSVCALLGLTLTSTALLVSIVRRFRERDNADEIERAQDLAYVAELILFDEKSLTCALKTLDIKIDRVQRRITRFFGGSDRLALFAIVASIYAVWNAFPPTDPLWQETWFFLGISFLVGIALGGIMSNMMLARYLYQKDLLQLALEYRKQEITLPQHYAFPKPLPRTRMQKAYRFLERLPKPAIYK